MAMLLLLILYDMVTTKSTKVVEGFMSELCIIYYM